MVKSELVQPEVVSEAELMVFYRDVVDFIDMYPVLLKLIKEDGSTKEQTVEVEIGEKVHRFTLWDNKRGYTTLIIDEYLKTDDPDDIGGLSGLQMFNHDRFNAWALNEQGAGRVTRDILETYQGILYQASVRTE